MFCSNCGQKIIPSDKFCRQCGAPVVTEAFLEKQKIDIFPKTEKYLRRILGILLLAVSLPIAIISATAFLFSVFFGMLLIIIFGIYLLKSKKYHFLTDIFFAGLSFILYSLPLGGGFPPIAPLILLKGSWLTADWMNSGISSDSKITIAYFVLAAIYLIFTTTAFFILFSNIFSKIKLITKCPKRNLISGLTFLLVIIIIFALPWLHKVQVSDSSSASGAPPDSGIILSATGSELKHTVKFDSDKNVWVYEVQLVNTSQREAIITALKAKTLNGRTIVIAPPFNANVEVVGGERMTDKIIIDVTLIPATEPDNAPIQKPAILKIYSQEPLILIAWVEENGRVGGNISFWK